MRTNYLIPCFLLGMTACLTNVPDPAVGGIYACEVQEDCPGSLNCLAKVCEAIELPSLTIANPEEEKPYAFNGEPLETLNIRATNFVLRPLAESNEAVPGEGHVVVFLDGEEIATIDSGDLTGGVLMEIQIPVTVPGGHRIHAQARFNDGTNYDNPEAVARRLVWVDDGEEARRDSLPMARRQVPARSDLAQRRDRTVRSHGDGRYRPANDRPAAHPHLLRQRVPRVFRHGDVLQRLQGRRAQ